MEDTWTYTQIARINGQPSVLVASGPLVGWWLALDARMTRDSTLFTDIDASAFRDEIIWLHGQGITHGCTTWAFCPRAGVTREQMASFLVRALKLPATTRDFFTDDETSQHESDHQPPRCLRHHRRLRQRPILSACGRHARADGQLPGARAEAAGHHARFLHR